MITATIVFAALAVWQYVARHRLRVEHVRILKRLAEVERLLHAAYTEPAQRHSRGEAAVALRAITRQVPA